MNIIKNIFGKNKIIEPIDLSVLKTDMHSHLIPKIDDGVDSIEEAVNCLRCLSEKGYKKSIITPHVMGDYYKNDSETILNGLNELREAIDKEDFDIEIEASAEYLVDEHLMKLLEGNQILSFGKNYVLIELSFFSPPENLKSILFEFQISGYNVILAHPERYSFWYHNLTKYEELKNQNIYFQLNMNSLTATYSNSTKKIAEKLVDMEMYEFIGTDIHSIDFFNRIDAVLHNEYLHKLINSGKILNHTL